MDIINGKWKGYYIFGLGYEPPDFGKKVKFEIELNGPDDKFTGICREEKNNEYALDDDSEIYGFIDDGFISFVKSYENTPKEKNENAMYSTLSEKHEVKYTGIYHEETNSFFGQWTIEMEYMEEGELKVFDLEGIWEMQKI